MKRLVPFSIALAVLVGGCTRAAARGDPGYRGIGAGRGSEAEGNEGSCIGGRLHPEFQTRPSFTASG